MFSRSNSTDIPPLWRRVAGRLGLAPSPWVDRAGAEQDADYYDAMFAQDEGYRRPYQRSKYYFLWTVIADRARRSGTRGLLEVGCGTGQLAHLLADQVIVRITAPHTLGTGNIFDRNVFSTQPDDHLSKIIDGDHLLRTDVYRADEIGIHTPRRLAEVPKMVDLNGLGQFL